MIIISRGGIVVEEDVADGLRAGQLKEAVIYCYVQEPIPRLITHSSTLQT